MYLLASSAGELWGGGRFVDGVCGEAAEFKGDALGTLAAEVGGEVGAELLSGDGDGEGSGVEAEIVGVDGTRDPAHGGGHFGAGGDGDGQDDGAGMQKASAGELWRRRQGLAGGVEQGELRDAGDGAGGGAEVAEHDEGAGVGGGVEGAVFVVGGRRKVGGGAGTKGHDGAGRWLLRGGECRCGGKQGDDAEGAGEHDMG